MRTRVDSCSYWKHKLALRMDDLSPEDQKALQEHISTCTSCKNQRMRHAQTHALLQHSLSIPAPPGMCQYILAEAGKRRIRRSSTPSRLIQHILSPLLLCGKSLFSLICNICSVLRIRLLLPPRAVPARKVSEPIPRSEQRQVTGRESNIADHKKSAANRGMADKHEVMNFFVPGKDDIATSVATNIQRDG
jgi:anti-sigma factor RsiW